MPKAAKTEMSYSPKFRVTKKTNQIKSLSFSVNSCESPWSLDFSLNRKHTLYKRRHQQKNNRRELLPSLGSPSTHRVGWLWTPNANVPLPHRWSSDISDASQRDPVTTVGFPGGSVGKESTCNAGDPGSITGSEISPGEGNGYPLEYSCLENSMDRGAWCLPSMGS